MHWSVCFVLHSDKSTNRCQPLVQFCRVKQNDNTLLVCFVQFHPHPLWRAEYLKWRIFFFFKPTSSSLSYFQSKSTVLRAQLYPVLLQALFIHQSIQTQSIIPGQSHTCIFKNETGNTDPKPQKHGPFQPRIKGYTTKDGCRPVTCKLSW